MVLCRWYGITHGPSGKLSLIWLAHYLNSLSTYIWSGIGVVNDNQIPYHAVVWDLILYIPYYFVSFLIY